VIQHVLQISNKYIRTKACSKKEERGPRTEMQQLLQLLDDAKYVSWNRRRDDDLDVLRDIFWAHPDSVKLLSMFPENIENLFRYEFANRKTKSRHSDMSFQTEKFIRSVPI
jgi:hypothetical protein